jgi:hypothetical protein
MKILSIKKIFLLPVLSSVCIYGQGILKGSVIDSLTMNQLKGAEIILTGSGFPIPGDQVSRILIRGLDSKFANITFDGTRIPSASAKDKSIDLSIFPERDFQNIVLNKTVTSDEDADATPGSINLITGKAPDKRMIKAEVQGNYNRLDNSANQYNFTGIYGERFFGNLLGVQVDANAEKRIISSEYLKNNFCNISPSQEFYTNSIRINSISYSNAIKERYGANILFDFNTPDGGSIKFNNIFSNAITEYFSSEADSFTFFSYEHWTYNGVDNTSFSSQPTAPEHTFNYMKTEKQVFLSSISGSNYLFGFNIDWNSAFSESKNNHPDNVAIHSYGVESYYNDYQIMENRFSRLDIAARQKISGKISIVLNLNNITKSKEESSILEHRWDAKSELSSLQIRI